MSHGSSRLGLGKARDPGSSSWLKSIVSFARRAATALLVVAQSVGQLKIRSFIRSTMGPGVIMINVGIDSIEGIEDGLLTERTLSLLFLPEPDPAGVGVVIPARIVLVTHPAYTHSALSERARLHGAHEGWTLVRA